MRVEPIHDQDGVERPDTGDVVEDPMHMRAVLEWEFDCLGKTVYPSSIREGESDRLNIGGGVASLHYPDFIHEASTRRRQRRSGLVGSVPDS